MDEPQDQNKDQIQDNELEETKKQRDEYLAGWQRAKADFINYKKEEMAHLQEAVKYGNEDLIKDLVSVMEITMYSQYMWYSTIRWKWKNWPD